jgi:hypothetical protein
VNQYRFLNTTQPQTLMIATLFCYIDAFFGLIAGDLILLVIALGLGLGGFGIANEKKWGYLVGTASAILQLVLLIAVAQGDLVTFPVILTLVFDVALVMLLLHPESRDYQRIWFK